MMSAAQSQTLEAKLEALQCHFTWDLNPGRSKLLLLKDILEDIGTEEGNSWLGHIYNLRGYIQYKLGFTEDAQSLFNQAAEALRQTRGAEEGPWLVVNYGNLSWLHHHLGEQDKSQGYLSKVDALMNKYPSQDELHPEIYAEKAWTLMKFSTDQKQRAVDYFQRAIRMQPDMVEWHTSHVLALVGASKDPKTKVEVDILKEMEDAKKRDPENLYLAALYLEACAKKGRIDKEEARKLGREVLTRPVSSFNGNTPILRLYRMYGLEDEAIELAEEALRRHPGERFLKWSAANCYKWVLENRKDHALQDMIKRGISLCEEVISLYSHHSLKIKIALANMYRLLNNQDEAEEIFVELLKITDLEPAEEKLLYINYRKSFKCEQQNRCELIQPNTAAAAAAGAEIPQQSSICSFTGPASESWRRLNSELETEHVEK